MFFCRSIFGLAAVCVWAWLTPLTAQAGSYSHNVVVVEPAQGKARVDAGNSASNDQPLEAPTELVPLTTPELVKAEASLFSLPGWVLTLPEALAQALGNNPALMALDFETQAAGARELQGSLKPNPELEAEISQFLGTAEMKFFRSATTSVGISQLIERGQKRCARMAVAQREGDVVKLERERTRLDLMLAVSRAYYAVLIAQERLRVAQEQEQLTQQVFDVVALKVEAGKAAQLELSRVKLDQVNARIELDQAQQSFDNARRQLAAQWGASESDFGSVEGELALPQEVPGFEQLSELLSAAPDSQRWQAEAELRQAKRELACAEGVPDYTISGGIERFEDSDSLGLRIGFSIPLPAHSRNEGNIMEAQTYIAQTESLRQADLLKAQQELSATYADLAAAFSLATRLNAEVLPAAQDTFELTNYGYRYGKFGILEVLDAERTLVEAHSQYVEALAAYQLSAVELERLIAQPLNTLLTESAAGAAPAASTSQDAIDAQSGMSATQEATSNEKH